MTQPEFCHKIVLPRVHAHDYEQIKSWCHDQLGTGQVEGYVWCASGFWEVRTPRDRQDVSWSMWTLFGSTTLEFVKQEDLIRFQLSWT
jgi:hypothetical protein